MKNFQKFFYDNDYVNFYGIEVDITKPINYNFKELKINIKNKLL